MWNSLLLSIVAVFTFGMSVSLPPTSVAQDAADSDSLLATEPDAGTAIDLLFESEVDEIVSRGFLQRTSFSEMLGRSEQRLQIAFVIDGTDSMGNDISSVVGSLENMAADIRRTKPGENSSPVSFSLVVYRDSDSPSGGLSLPIDDRFTTNASLLSRTLQEIKPEDGSPYFEELVDVGVYSALTALDWDMNEETSRWIIIFGDAPPYSNSVEYRQYHEDDLVAIAKEKKISISSVLCSSGFIGDHQDKNALADTYETALPMTRTFMSDLADRTGGAHLDLSMPHLREQLSQAAQSRQHVTFQQIDKISASDIEHVKSTSENDHTLLSTINRQRVVVLPHVPLEQMNFDHDAEGVQVATEVRNRLRLLPGFEVRTTAKTQQKFEEIKADLPDGSTAEVMQQLAIACRAEWVIWGNVSRSGDKVVLRSEIFRKIDGEKVASAERIAAAREFTGSGNELGERALVPVVTEQLITNTVTHLVQGGYDETKIAAFHGLEEETPGSNAFMAPIANSIRARREILAGLEQLERALAFEKDAPQSISLLEGALANLNSAALLDEGNPLIHMAIASVYFNLARSETNDENLTRYYKSLQRAFEVRDATKVESIRIEIEGDYLLLIERDIDQAIARYEEIVASSDELPVNAVLRAHWMLAGIYCGDWGAESAINPSLARDHIIRILSLWPDSAEASYYRDALGWDQTQGSQVNLVPREHPGFSKRN